MSNRKSINSANDNQRGRQRLKLIAKRLLVLFALIGIVTGIISIVWVSRNGGGALSIPLSVAVMGGSLFLGYYAYIL